jgi:hypothetical protein
MKRWRHNSIDDAGMPVSHHAGPESVNEPQR